MFSESVCSLDTVSAQDNVVSGNPEQDMGPCVTSPTFMCVYIICVYLRHTDTYARDRVTPNDYTTTLVAAVSGW